MADSVDRAVGARLRDYRLLSGASQEAFARRLGISYQQLQKYERGSNRIAAGRLYRIARLLEVPIDDFFADWDCAVALPDMSREGLELIRAFRRIGDAGLRQRLCRLVAGIAAGRETRPTGHARCSKAAATWPRDRAQV